jgi:hypothetical protein
MAPLRVRLHFGLRVWSDLDTWEISLPTGDRYDRDLKQLRNQPANPQKKARENRQA